jgi:sucrose-6F-phosphate phosphohydrolase
VDKLLLCTDLDRTLIPNGSQSESHNARKLFSNLVKHEAITLVYVTGRDKTLVKKAITYYELPTPDYVVSDVGATIYQIDANASNQWVEYQQWQECFKSDWKGKTSQTIAALFADFSVLRKQEVSKQKKYKLSYYVPVQHDYHRLIEQMQQRLKNESISAELIWSIDEPLGIGLLDVMPRHATKKNAILFLMQELLFDFNNTLFSGDSGNDIDVMLSPIKSILVANAHSDVKNVVQQSLATNTVTDDSVYMAKGGFMNMNGNYSAGILEGVNHYVSNFKKWMGENQ